MNKPEKPTEKDKRTKAWREYRDALKAYEAHEATKDIEVESELVKPATKGIGDRIAYLTKSIGIKPCEKCKSRQALLNTYGVSIKRPMDQDMVDFFLDFSMPNKLEAKFVKYIKLSYLHVFGIDQHICFHCGSAFKIVTRMVKQLKEVARKSTTNE